MGRVGTVMSSLTSRVAKIPANNPIGPIIIHISKIGIETCIGLPAASIRIQIYLPMKVSITRKCNHARIIISSVENKSTTRSGVGICEPNVINTSGAFGIKRAAYEMINGKTQILTSPTILRVVSCFGRNHIKNQSGKIKSEENQNVTVDNSTITPHCCVKPFFYNVLYESGGNSMGGPSYPQAKSTGFLHPVTPRHPWPQVGLLRSRPDLFPRLFNSRLLPVSVHDTRVTWGRDIYVRLWEPIDRLSRPLAFGPPFAICGRGHANSPPIPPIRYHWVF